MNGRPKNMKPEHINESKINWIRPTLVNKLVSSLLSFFAATILLTLGIKTLDIAVDSDI
jgi:hypothetical protein